ncbi:spore coat protein [Paenibacillus sp. UNC499MF]|uniref:spore coat protein n=1 Tax=Paenibacillus sp. UNC499MF TaxID=1502751 RepID=UPI00089FEDC6|nr:spore coat protein [Paenibacillus sp. UNC499MF]SEG51274.1 Coat F domain-containing protein [Paenibacillus sp. UNC499MF]
MTQQPNNQNRQLSYQQQQQQKHDQRQQQLEQLFLQDQSAYPFAQAFQQPQQQQQLQQLQQQQLQQQQQQQLQQQQQQNQQQQNPQNGSPLSDKDLLYTILADHKRVVREYATAATESTCPEIRQLFNHLTLNTLLLQGELYAFMKQNNMYSTPSPALRQDIDKQIQHSQQSGQQTQQRVNPYLSSGGQHPVYSYIQPPYNQAGQAQQLYTS